MEKNTDLINIYLKIHQRRELSFEDLEYLARFDPECFEKTCHNVVYNIPQAKPVMLPKRIDEVREKQSRDWEKTGEIRKNQSTQEGKTNESGGMVVPGRQEQKEKKFFIEEILENLKHLDGKRIPHIEVDMGRVKNLLGSLYMELLFPHNDKEGFLPADYEIKGGSFDKKA